MKNCIIIFLLFISFKSFSQQGFETIISTSTDLYATQSFCIDNGYLIISSRKFDENLDGIIYKLNTEGLLVDSLLIEEDSYNTYFNYAFYLDNGLIRTLSIEEKENQTGFYNIKTTDIDENLNIYNEILYEDIVIGGFWSHIHAIPFSNDRIYFASTAMDTLPYNGLQYLNKLMFVMNQQGEILFDSIYNQSSLEMTMDFIRFPGTNNLLLYCRSNFEGGNIVKPINIIDTNYNLIESYFIEDYSLQASLRALNETTLVIVNKESGNGKEPWYTAISTYDLNFERINHIITGQDDTASYPAYNNSIALIQNNIYVGSTFNVISEDFPTVESFFKLDKLDINLNIKWQKYYGGDAYYELLDVRETNDNGVILTGTRYDHGETGPFEKDIFILKVNEDGIIIGNDETERIPIKNAIITPNPGRNYLQLHTNFYPSKLQLFKMDGQIILDENIQENTTTFNMSNLTSGTYIWSLIKDGQVVEKGKWVKE